MAEDRSALSMLRTTAGLAVCVPCARRLSLKISHQGPPQRCYFCGSHPSAALHPVRGLEPPPLIRLPADELATLCRITPAAARMRLSRARRRAVV